MFITKNQNENEANKQEEENIKNNVYSFSQLVGYPILDPYGKDIDCYRYVFQLLEGGMPMLIDKLIPEETRAEFRNKPRGRKKKNVNKKEN